MAFNMSKVNVLCRQQLGGRGLMVQGHTRPSSKAIRTDPYENNAITTCLLSVVLGCNIHHTAGSQPCRSWN